MPLAGRRLLPNDTLPVIDVALARRLELAEGLASAAYIDARRAAEPGVQATWTRIAGAVALFDGPGSPLTQSFGVGLFERVGDAELDQLEAFFAERGAAASHEVSAFAQAELWNLLSRRGYTPIESSTVLIRPATPPSSSVPGSVTARAIRDGETELWCSVAAEGWSSESAELSAFVRDFGRVISRAHGVHCFIAELDGEPIAAGALSLGNDVALLAGASTIPSARGRGAQTALLQARLAFAAARGIELAMMVAQPGSPSQRNAVRQGFRAAYVRSKWHRLDPGA